MLKNIEIPKIYYSLPKENITDEIFIPAIQASKSLDIMTGWFSSGAIAELSTGLSYFLKNTNGRVRIVTCPVISNQDQIAIEKGAKNPPEVLADFFSNYIDDVYSKTALEKHSLNCMSYLISEKRLEIKLAYMKDKKALFHKKINILCDDNDTLVITGSTNFTPKGLRRNEEQANLHRSWASSDENNTIIQIKNEFKSSWEKGNTDSYVLCNITDAIKNNIVEKYQLDRIPKVKDYNALIEGITNKNLLKELESNSFHLPNYINYDSGDYKHQGHAINAWINSNYKGILQMCTGAGKTITSLICALKLKDSIDELIVIVAVPKEPLLNQWADDVKSFSGAPIIIKGSPTKKFKFVQDSIRRIVRKISEIEFIICTHEFLCDPRLHSLIGEKNIDILLIADEVHNLGVKSFLSNTPKMIQYRLGLSATPQRQFDPSGTDQLFKYFGNVCFEFNLQDAIGICLVHYDYHVHPVHLTVDEMDRYIELTKKIKKYAWVFDKGEKNTSLDVLLRKRRLLLEQADNKVIQFKKVFSSNETKGLKHILVFLSSKQHSQIDEINHYLQHEYGLLIHQITGKETQNGLSKKIIEDFKNEKIQLLTSMKVLDEGLNIPEIKTAYILASSTVEREWTQRRGRVLRKCDAIKKEKAVIHDFIVIVPNDKDFSSLIKSEKKRVIEFAKLSNNPWDQTGGLKILNEYYGV